MATTAKRRSSLTHATPARRQLPRWLSPGVHLAPFRSKAGHPVLVNIWSPGVLFAMAEITEIRGTCFWLWPSVRPESDHWKFIPHDEHLLPRGVHRAPWRVRPLNSAFGNDPCPVFVAIDDQHRLVEMLAVEACDAELEAEAQRTLTALLEAHDESELAAAAARAPNDPVPVLDQWGFTRIKPTHRGIWSRHNREFYFVDSQLRHIATVSLEGQHVKDMCPLRIARALWRVLDDFDPFGADDDDDDRQGEESWA